MQPSSRYDDLDAVLVRMLHADIVRMFVHHPENFLDFVFVAGIEAEFSFS